MSLELTTELPPYMRKRLSVAPDGCWLVTGGLDKGGYARFKVNGASRQAHRAVYTILVDPIPADLPLDHLCRVRNCVNPDHLEPVTQRENVRRSVSPAGATLNGRCQRGHDVSLPGALRRGECQECRLTSKREHFAQASLVRSVPPHVSHGSFTAYNYYACRCKDCRAFVVAKDRERKQRRAVERQAS
jgi:hypothetical protein